MSQAVKAITLEDEYKKKTGITPEDVRKMRQWLQTQPHLPRDHLTDLDLILVYHCCHRSMEVSKQVLDLNCTLRTLFTNLFKDRLPDGRTLVSMKVPLVLPLEVRAYDDSAVIYCRLLDYNTKNFIFQEAIKIVLMVIDLWQYQSGTWPGLVIVIDLDKVTLSHLARLDIQTVQQFLFYLQEAMFVKLQGLHFMNAPSFMDRLLMILKPFMKKELIDMMVIHQIGSKTIGKYLPIEGLPKQAGGEYKPFEEAQADVIANAKANYDYFAEENKKRVVESLRPGKPKTITDIFGGIEGSFKKLEID
ncbi:alpha-tocopherol transfer protein-like [Bombyx mori]|uniref:CRAL-TRIO domain-containing protein n=1 Tax=Bombyx mori TaxID=7091 RepID=A0A8R2AKM9_BOMMO|nr:alpha-tocopherol transfer protein-like [Bombyx mori]